MDVTIHPNHLSAELSVRVNQRDPELVSLLVDDQGSGLRFVLDRDGWQQVADLLAGVGITARPVDEQPVDVEQQQAKIRALRDELTTLRA